MNGPRTPVYSPCSNVRRAQAVSRSAVSRSAFSLIEVLTIMAVLGLLMTTAVTLISRAGSSHRDAMRIGNSLHTLDTMAERLRSDASRAMDVVTLDNRSIELHFSPTRRAVYAIQSDRVERHAFERDQQVGVEHWPLMAGRQSTLTLVPPDSKHVTSLVKLIIKTENIGQNSLNSDALEVVSRVGHGRLSDQSEAAKETESSNP